MGAHWTEVDLAIAGNGALGCALALRFAEEHPTARVALVGRSTRPGSASAAAAAMLGAFAEVDATTASRVAARAKLAFAIAASDRWPAHVEALRRRGCDVAIELGTTVICRARPESRGALTFDAITRALTEQGQPFERLDAHTVRIPHEGRVSAAALLDAYDAALSRMPNVDVVDAEVERISVDGGTKVVATSAGTLTARDVVIAAGVRSQRLVDQLELSPRIPRLVAGVGVAVVLRDVDAARDVLRFIADDPTGGPYLVPLSAGRVYLGATNDVMETGTSTPPPAAVSSLVEAAATVADPRLREAGIEQTLLGWRPTTLDTYPLIGPTSLDGVWLASGTKRDGLHLSPLIAEELTRCIGGNEREPFAGRFLPERPLLLDLPKRVAVASTVDGLVRRGAVRDEAEQDVLAVYERVGLASSDRGIPPEVFDMYRRGVAAANLAFYGSRGPALAPPSANARDA